MGLGVVAFFVGNTPGARTIPPEFRRTQPQSKPNSEPVAPRVETAVTEPSLSRPLVASVVGEQVRLEPSSIKLPEGADPKMFAVDQTVQALKLNGVRVLGVDVQQRNALVELTPNVQNGMGSMQEAKFLEALQTVLGQFPDVDKVQIMVEGKPLDSLGHFETADPMPVIRAGGKQNLFKPESAPAGAAKTP